MGERRGWVGLFRSLGEAVGELFQTELQALGRDLERSGKQVLLGLALFAVAAAFLFWMFGALTYSLIQLLSQWLPQWGAALAVAGFLALLAVVAWLLGKGRWSRAESPVRTVRRRVDDHLRWWTKQLPGDDESLAPEEDDLP